MADIITQLPGISLPVSEISKKLSRMWQGELEPNAAAPSDFRASQMNLVIQMGLGVTVEEAEELFNTGIDLAQRYPCRIIFLCPTTDPASHDELTGKLFTQCYIGKSLRERCCCEVLLLEYSVDEPEALFNQVSIWLESDLPTYHWFHKLPLEVVTTKYTEFIQRSKRAIYDSEVDCENSECGDIDGIENLRDLADARILPYKQSIGQILSTFQLEQIFEGLKGMTIIYQPNFKGSATQIKKWLEKCLDDPMVSEEIRAGLVIELKECEVGGAEFELNFDYDNDQRFNWKRCGDHKHSEISIQIGNRKIESTVVVSAFPPAQALSEAIFFG